jgi:AraC-like DNA-binding protein
MKPILQQLPLQPNTSFLACTFRMPDFETGWHLHEANELILFTAGSGLVSIGNYESIYNPGDVYFLGSNLVHRFQPNDNNTSAIIIHFKEDCLGKDFINLPEFESVKHLLHIAKQGLQITSGARNHLQPLIKALELTTELNRIILLLKCLQTLAVTKNQCLLSTEEIQTPIPPDKDSIGRIINYTRDSFQEQVTLPHVAAMACMSIPSFCYYFKRCTQKTYINYLNEVRIAYACIQLVKTNKPVTDIGYESGFNTVSHFHRQFLRLKHITPLQYRKDKQMPSACLALAGSRSDETLFNKKY